MPMGSTGSAGVHRHEDPGSPISARKNADPGTRFRFMWTPWLSGMIWNAKQAVLEVENYLEAGVLSRRRRSRDSIGKHDLADLFSRSGNGSARRSRAPSTLRPIRGVSRSIPSNSPNHHPAGSQDAMSKRAQAERGEGSPVCSSAPRRSEIARKFARGSRKLPR
jgi:hypothetical protein